MKTDARECWNMEEGNEMERILVMEGAGKEAWRLG